MLATAVLALTATGIGQLTAEARTVQRPAAHGVGFRPPAAAVGTIQHPAIAVGTVQAAAQPNASPGASAGGSGTAGKHAFSKPLNRALDRYLDEVPGQVAISVRDLSTGTSYSYNRGLRTATASIVKVDLVMALLLKAQRQRRGLTAGERRTAERAIRVSDNAAATALWSAIGGASGLAAANRKFGLRETRPDPGGAWGATTTSAADQVRLLGALASSPRPLSARNRRYVLGLMAGVSPDQGWGVSASGRKGAGVALKNGWLPRERHGGRWTVNSIGRVRDRGHTFLIAVISHRHGSMAAGVRAVERVSRLVTGVLARQG